MAGGERAARGNGGHRRGWPAGVVVGAAWPAVVADMAACVDPQAVGWGSAVDLAAAPTPVCR